MSSRDRVLDVLNRSGFPLQLAVEDKIRTSSTNTGWDVLYDEHPWVDVVGQQERFIDLVAVRKPYYALIECKKLAPESKPWVFITDTTKPRERYRSVLLSLYVEDGLLRGGFRKVSRAIPEAEEAQFCAKHRDNLPTLEVMSTEVLRATEEFSREVLRVLNKEGRREWRVFLPIIVTNAELQLAHINPKEVAVEDGALASVEAQPVEWIRFHKTLAYEKTSIEGAINEYTHLYEAHRQQERTVLVCRASSITSLLGMISDALS